MKLIKASVELIKQNPGIEGILKNIELAARVCYKSENKITDNSYIKFIDNLLTREHLSPLEHGTVYLYIPPHSAITGYKYRDNKYSEYVEIRERESPNPIVHKYITTNYRVLIENHWVEDLKYQCEPKEFHKKRITLKFVLSRGIAMEFLRHRVFSFSMESTRFINYSTNKYESGLTFIIPDWLDIEEGEYYNLPATLSSGFQHTKTNSLWFNKLSESEAAYKSLIKDGWSPQQARDVLPNALKTELFMTGYLEDWEYFCKLRTSKSAHPDASFLAKQVLSQIELL